MPEELPTPGEAQDSLPGFAFAFAMNSAMLPMPED
jgi:hypothetical protein